MKYVVLSSAKKGEGEIYVFSHQVCAVVSGVKYVEVLLAGGQRLLVEGYIDSVVDRIADEEPT